MKKFKFLAVLVAVLFLLAAPAAATVWTDTYYADHYPLGDYMAAGDSLEIPLDLTNDGFDSHLSLWPPDFNRDIALSYKIDIYVSDDLFDPYDRQGEPGIIGSWEEEYLQVVTAGIFGPYDEQTYEVDFNILDWPLSYPTSIHGLLDINAGGDINLILSAVSGDFYFFKAKLTASDSNSVPEPGTLVLLGLGMVGLAGMGRKRLLKK